MPAFRAMTRRSLIHMEGLVDRYVADASLSWSNTILEGKGVGTGCAVDGPVLFASFMMRVRRDCGGSNFWARLWQEADLRPDAATTQEAVDNLVLAASAASERNLTTLCQYNVAMARLRCGKAGSADALWKSVKMHASFRRSRRHRSCPAAWCTSHEFCFDWTRAQLATTHNRAS